MQIHNSFTQLLDVEFPVIMAPMFLVSNEAMVIAAMQSGIVGTFPTLNYRETGDLEKAFDAINAAKADLKVKGTYGVNLIVQRTNPKLDEHLKICVEKKVPFYITSLGSPKKVIDAAKTYGAKVFCDVTNITHAKKCYDLGCDGFIAVGQGAGGHAGPNPLSLLVPALKNEFPDKIVVAAGGIASGDGIVSVLALGAEAASIGTRFIASDEAGVKQDYKQAIVDSTMDDVVMTTKISGTPCNIINTPYAKKIGYEQNWFEKLLSTNKTTKKYFKMLVQFKGMKNLEQSVHPASYKTLWVVGKSVDMVHDIVPVKTIVERLEKETKESLGRLNNMKIV